MLWCCKSILCASQHLNPDSGSWTNLLDFLWSCGSTLVVQKFSHNPVWNRCRYSQQEKLSKLTIEPRDMVESCNTFAGFPELTVQNNPQNQSANSETTQNQVKLQVKQSWSSHVTHAAQSRWSFFSATKTISSYHLMQHKPQFQPLNGQKIISLCKKNCNKLRSKSQFALLKLITKNS